MSSDSPSLLQSQVRTGRRSRSEALERVARALGTVNPVAEQRRRLGLTHPASAIETPLIDFCAAEAASNRVAAPFSEGSQRKLEAMRISAARPLPRVNASNDDIASSLQDIPAWASEISISYLALPTRHHGLLLRHGIVTVGDLSRLTSNEMLRWRYFGQRRLKELRAAVMSLLLRGEAQQTWREDPLQPGPHRGSMMQLARTSLRAMSELEGLVWKNRTGFDCSRKTLRQVATDLQLSRERIRQIEVNMVKNYRKLNWWVDAIAPRIGELLKTSGSVLYLEDLERQDSWFAGVSAQPNVLKFLLKNFSKSQMRVLEYRGKLIVAEGVRGERSIYRSRPIAGAIAGGRHVERNRNSEWGLSLARL